MRTLEGLGKRVWLVGLEGQNDEVRNVLRHTKAIQRSAPCPLTHAPPPRLSSQPHRRSNGQTTPSVAPRLHPSPFVMCPLAVDSW